MKKIISVLFAIFAFTMPAIACETNEIDTGSACVESKFEITTSETDTFKFTMSARGTFYVDCGNGGILSSSADDVTDKTIIRTNTTSATYTCSWDLPSAQTIHFAGSATGYTSTGNVGCIAFYTGSNGTQDKIVAIGGSLGAIFSTLGQNNGQQPRFIQTFRGTKITSIPSELFSGVTGGIDSMFLHTFNGCSSLTAIPTGLFAGITKAANSMFNQAFYGCRNLSGYIPSSAFSGLFANGSPTAKYMWYFAFISTKLRGSCPTGTEEVNTNYKGGDGIADDAVKWGNFVSCYDPTPQTCAAGEYLPQYYDSCIQCPAGKYCTGGTYSFNETTNQGLSGNISAGYFGNGGTTTATPTSEDCLSGYTCGTCQGQTGFNGRPLYTDAGGGASACSECPAVSDELISRVRSYNYYPSTRNKGIYGCLATFSDSDDAATFTTICYRGGGTYGDSNSACHTYAPTACAAGKYNTITQTPEWRYAGDNAATCLGIDCMNGRVCTDTMAGYYSPEGATTQTICPAGTFSPTGSAVCYPHILHVGDSNVYLKSTKQTTPSLNFRIGNDIFYANMTTTRTKMNKDSSQYFHAQWGNNDYYVCDDTTCPNVQ